MSSKATMNKPRAFAAVLFGFVGYGWDAGVLGGVLQTGAFQHAMKFPNTTIGSTIVAAFLLASWLGCCTLASPWSDRFGRRHWIIVGNVVQIVGTVISVSSQSSAQMIAGRVVIGIGNGFVMATGPIYVVEITSETQRGEWVGSLLFAACTGTAMAYWVDFGCTYLIGQIVWRLPVAFQIIWSLLSIIFIWPSADSPRWYCLQRRGDEALAVLRQLSPENDATQTYREILKELEQQETAEPLRFSDLIYDRSSSQAARRIRNGVILVGIAYLMGTNMIFYYMSTIFEVYIGLGAVTSSILSGAATTLLAIGVLVGSILCEKSSRRTWLQCGSAAQTIFIIAFIALLAVGGEATAKATAAMLFGWILVFSLTWAPLPYVYVSETMPLDYRNTGVGLSMSAQWLMAFVTVYCGPIGYSHIGWKIWIVFALFNAIGGLFVHFIPETRGVRLECMRGIFNAAPQEVTEA